MGKVVSKVVVLEGEGVLLPQRNIIGAVDAVRLWVGGGPGSVLLSWKRESRQGEGVLRPEGSVVPHCQQADVRGAYLPYPGAGAVEDQGGAIGQGIALPFQGG